MSDFAGTEYEFAAGSLYGLRGWNMDDKGRLHGVTHHEVWRPGENVSTCKQTNQVPCPKTNEREKAREASEAGRAKVESKKRKRNRDSAFINYTFEVDYHPSIACGDPTCVNGRYHVVSAGHGFDPTCQCGFWAYDEAGFVPHGSVIGVIEAYGKTTIGTKGFRAEKARIVGLCRENGNGTRLSRSVQARLSQLYPDALWCDDMDQVCTVFEGVLRTWAEVDESFWITPVPEVEDQFGFRAMTRAMFPRTSSLWYSGGVV